MSKTDELIKIKELKKSTKIKDVRYKNIKEGDRVFTEMGYGFDEINYFEHEVLEVDAENRQLKAKDHSLGGSIVTLEDWEFSTIVELKKEGIVLEGFKTK